MNANPLRIEFKVLPLLLSAHHYTSFPLPEPGLCFLGCSVSPGVLHFDFSVVTWFPAQGIHFWSRLHDRRYSFSRVSLQLLPHLSSLLQILLHRKFLSHAVINIDILLAWTYLALSYNWLYTKPMSLAR